MSAEREFSGRLTGSVDDDDQHPLAGFVIPTGISLLSRERSIFGLGRIGSGSPLSTESSRRGRRRFGLSI